MFGKKFVVEETCGNRKLTKSFLTRKSAQKYLLKRCKELTGTEPGITDELPSGVTFSYNFSEVPMSWTFKATTLYKFC